MGEDLIERLEFLWIRGISQVEIKFCKALEQCFQEGRKASHKMGDDPNKKIRTSVDMEIIVCFL